MSLENLNDDFEAERGIIITNVKKGGEIRQNQVKKNCKKCGRATYNKDSICLNCNNK